MGQPKSTPPAAAASPSYRDEPDAVSLHTTRSDYEYDDAPQLPSYDESVAGNSGAQAPSNADQDEFRAISLPPPISGKWGKTREHAPDTTMASETSIRMDEKLMDAEYLHDYITRYLHHIPPRPTICIKGWHWVTSRQDNKKTQDRQNDFNFVFDIRHLLGPHDDTIWWEPRVAGNPDKAYRGSWRKTRAPGFKQDIELGDNNEPPSLMDVCRDFANSKAKLKVFRVSRSLAGWDTSYLDSALADLVRSTQYRGHIEISFPVFDQNVDIYSPHWANKARISWVRWIFYLTFLWIITWPILFFCTRWWALYNVEWRFSVLEPGNNSNAPGAPSRRRHAVISEERWLRQHTNLIRHLVLKKTVGNVSSLSTDVEDPLSRRDFLAQLPRTGNANVDTAVSFIQGGVSAWNAVTRGSNAGGWGADERY